MGDFSLKNVNKYGFYYFLFILNFIADSSFERSNSNPFPMEFYFDGKIFLLVSIFIFSVFHLKQKKV